jgi:hypothetical protein
MTIVRRNSPFGELMSLRSAMDKPSGAQSLIR